MSRSSLHAVSCPLQGLLHRHAGRRIIPRLRVSFPDIAPDAAGHIDKVRARRRKPGCRFCRIRRRCPVLIRIQASQADGDGIILSHCLPDLLKNLAVNPRAVFHCTTSVPVCPVVCDRRKEFIQEIAVGRMDLHAVKARFLRPEGGPDKPLLPLDDLIFCKRMGQFLRLCPGMAHRARSHQRKPCHLRKGRRAGMIDLDKYLRYPLAVHRIRNLPKPRDRAVIGNRDHALAGLSLDIHIAVLENHQPGVSRRLPVILHLLRLNNTVLRAPRRHGRADNAVCEHQISHFDRFLV